MSINVWNPDVDSNKVLFSQAFYKQVIVNSDLGSVIFPNYSPRVQLSPTKAYSVITGEENPRLSNGSRTHKQLVAGWESETQSRTHSPISHSPPPLYKLPPRC